MSLERLDKLLSVKQQDVEDIRKDVIIGFQRFFPRQPYHGAGKGDRRLGVCVLDAQ